MKIPSQFVDTCGDHLGWQAVAYILGNTFNGRFAADGWPWVEDGRHGPDSRVLDARAMAAAPAYLSSGERFVLRFAASLVGQAEISLEDLGYCDYAITEVLLRALAHTNNLDLPTSIDTVRR